MKEKVLVSVVVVATAITSLLYCVEVIRGTITPTLATWIIFLSAVGLSFVFYLLEREGKKNTWLANLANAVDAGVVVFVFTCVVFFAHDVDTTFSVLDIICLVCAGIILLIWIHRRNAKEAYLLFQVVMVLAYVPTYQTLLEAQSNPESYWVWTTGIVASFISLYLTKINKEATPRQKFLAKVYAWRAIALASLVVLLMLRLELF